MSRNPKQPSNALSFCLIFLGVGLAGFFSLGLIGAFLDPKTSVGIYLVLVGFIIAGLFMIYFAIGRIKKNKRLLTYAVLINEQGHRSVEQIAKLVGMTDNKQVLEEIQAAMTAEIIIGYRLDPTAGRIFKLGEAAPPPLHARVITFVCSGCGAANQVKTIDGHVKCEYCGTPHIDER